MSWLLQWHDKSSYNFRLQLQRTILLPKVQDCTKPSRQGSGAKMENLTSRAKHFFVAFSFKKIDTKQNFGQYERKLKCRELNSLNCFLSPADCGAA